MPVETLDRSNGAEITREPSEAPSSMTTQLEVDLSGPPIW
jgi:hypothetical protein